MGKGGKRRKLRSNQLRNTDRASKSSEHDCDIVESIFPVSRFSGNWTMTGFLK